MKARDSGGFRRRIRGAVDVLRGYVKRLRKRDVDVRDLVYFEAAFYASG